MRDMKVVDESLVRDVVTSELKPRVELTGGVPDVY
jgi:hypothetical protein